MLNEVDKISKIFNKYGMGKGTKVVILLDNGIEFSTSFFAIHVCIPVYTHTGKEKLEAILDFYSPDFILTDKENSIHYIWI